MVCKLLNNVRKKSQNYSVIYIMSHSVLRSQLLYIATFVSRQYRIPPMSPPCRAQHPKVWKSTEQNTPVLGQIFSFLTINLSFMFFSKEDDMAIQKEELDHDNGLNWKFFFQPVLQKRGFNTSVFPFVVLSREFKKLKPKHFTEVSKIHACLLFNLTKLLKFVG